MQIFLLPVGQGRYIYYFEDEPAPSDEEMAPPSVSTGRLQRIKSKLIGGYRRLQDKRPMAERICARLRKLETIELLYPKGLAEADVRESFFDFLRRRFEHERSWKKRDTLIACLGAPLFFIPGPNVWFYYPAIRALGHYYAESGCRKFLSSWKTTRRGAHILFTPTSKLTEVQRLLQDKKRLNKTRIAQIGQSLGLTSLVDVFEKRFYQRDAFSFPQRNPS